MIAQGHTNPWSYTPRQIQAFAFIAHRRKRRETANEISIGVLASRGDQKALKKQMKELTKE